MLSLFFKFSSSSIVQFLFKSRPSQTYFYPFDRRYTRCKEKEKCLDEENYKEDCIDLYHERDDLDEQRAHRYGMYFLFSLCVLVATAGIVLLFYYLGLRYFRMPFPRLVWVFDPKKHLWDDPEATVLRCHCHDYLQCMLVDACVRIDLYFMHTHTRVSGGSLPHA